MAVLTDLSKALADTVTKVGPSVIRVEARSHVSASGVAWTSGDVVVTTHHVLEREEGIKVGLPDGSMASADLAGRDPSTDIAVLRVKGASLKAAPWADLDGVGVGHLALALGRPGRSVRATLGIVSALGDAWRTPSGGNIDRYLQTDVVMYPGFSGGPLVSASGSVIGINSSALARGSSVAIPTSTIRRVVETLLAYGRVKRGYLGVGAQPVRLPAAVAQQFGQETGLLVMSVEQDSPAGRAGLLLGDVLVKIGEEPLRFPDSLLAYLTGDRVGSAAPLTVLRGGEARTVQVTIGERQ